MENLGDILKRLATTREVANGDSGANQSESAYAAAAEDQKSCDVCEGRGWFTADVPAGHPEFGQVVTCRCQVERLKQEQSVRLLRYSNLGHLPRFTFEALDPDGRAEDSESRQLFRQAFDAAVQYAADTAGWLVFTGPNGSGKTHLAAAIANRCIESGTPAFFVHVPDLLDHLRAGFAPDSELSYSDLFDQVRNTPLLILDGLGSQSATPWAQEKLQQIINHRFNTELPTVVTTAVGLKEIDPYIRARLETKGLTRVLEVRSRETASVEYLGRIEPEMLRRMTFETYDTRGNDATAQQQTSLAGACQFAKNYASDPDGWLTLFGETGVGKTHLAVAIAAHRIDKGHPVSFAFVPELLDYLRYTFTPESRVTYDTVFDQVKNAPLLILDDLGQEQSSPWAEEKLYQIVVHRHNARLPTVITSTLDFADQTGPISSRIRDPYVGVLIRVEAPDYRIRSRDRVERPSSSAARSPTATRSPAIRRRKPRAG